MIISDIFYLNKVKLTLKLSFQFKFFKRGSHINKVSLYEKTLEKFIVTLKKVLYSTGFKKVIRKFYSLFK